MDPREAIILRLMDVVAEVENVQTILRNVVAVEDDTINLPAVIVIDGDESAIEDDPSRRPGNVPRRFEMTPLLLVAHASKPEDIGTDMNTMRARIIKAVLEDSELKQLCDRGNARYDGMESPRLETGRLIVSQKFMRFIFTYILDPRIL